MNRASISRRVALVLAIAGGLIMPGSAQADATELRQCLHNCYIAYVVETNQPAFYQECVAYCNDTYGV